MGQKAFTKNWPPIAFFVNETYFTRFAFPKLILGNISEHGHLKDSKNVNQLYDHQQEQYKLAGITVNRMKIHPQCNVASHQ